ncbi:immunity protein YezG family protein [Pseudoalteromonas carrageenovora]|uniref:immunity protein YezG family protein n=1 Tax=Pseudoalteromonas carrageenovora TaxID=227 RepID=UPI00311F7D4A
MFKTVDEIYSHIGQAMFNALPDRWDTAWYDIFVIHPDGVTQSNQQYSLNDVIQYFNVNKINGINKYAGCDDAFEALYKIMQKNEDDVPWNKARFEITSDGDFSIDFKYDEDFAWYKSLDIDSQEYDDLDIDVINQIKSWEGLPESYPRYWAKTLLVLPDVDTLTRADVSAFTLKHNNSALLKEHWQDKYSDNAMRLWEEVKQTYKNKAESIYSIEELIFVLNYDFAVMPYQNSEEGDLGFYKWIFIEISKLS